MKDLTRLPFLIVIMTVKVRYYVAAATKVKVKIINKKR